MRGLSSMFGTKRPDKAPTTHGSATNDLLPPSTMGNSRKPSQIFGALSRKSHLVAANDQAQSSCSSSSGANSFRTPAEDEGFLRNNKVAWIPWLGRKKSNVSPNSVPREQWEQDWRSHPPQVSQPPQGQIPDETEDESSSESDDESEIVSAPADLPALTITPSMLAKSRSNLRALIASSLQPPLSPAPFLYVPGQPIFPRSCNRHRALYTQETMETCMHRNQILQQLDQQQVTRAQELSIISFAVLPTLTIKRPSLQLDDNALSENFQIRTYCQGLQRWALRPCFEDRVDVWTLEEGTGHLLRKQVTGPNLGVAALEISEALDVLAGAIAEESDLESPSTHSNIALHIPSASHQGRNAPTLPSPLRMEHGPPPMPCSNHSSTEPEIESRTMPAVPTVKRGVRFAEDDKEDQIPLGYILRIKKKREDRAKFLLEEKERRVFEEDRTRQEEERLKREAERQEWDKEKKAWDKEKKAMEEERRRRQYAEEVVAARVRREASRSGFYVWAPSHETDPSQSREPKSGRSALDITHSPRSQASETVVMTGTPGSPYTASPASSNPPSANGGSPTASGYFSSRPPSVNSANTTLSSAEDLQQHRKNATKRSSLGSDHSIRQTGDRASQAYYPVWSSGYLVPPIAHMPSYPMNMPLLPPTPPFMMEQNRRSHSPNSRSKSRSSSPSQIPNGSHNGSQERLSSSRRSDLSSPRSERQHHRRGSSDDAMRDGQKLSLPNRRPGSAVETYNGRSTTQRNQQSSHPPVTSRSQSFGATSTLHHDSPGRAPSNRRQSVIT